MTKMSVAHLYWESVNVVHPEQRVMRENTTVQMLRESSGIFHYLATEMNAALLMDVASEHFICEIYPSVTAGMADLTLGQALIISMDRAEAQGLSPQTLVRLSLGAANVFSNARQKLLKAADDSDMTTARGVAMSAPPDTGYEAICALCHALCRARFYYYAAVARKVDPSIEKEYHGECIRWLVNALQQLERSPIRQLHRRMSGRFEYPGGTMTVIDSWRERISSFLDEMRTENDRIFMEAIPDSVSEPPSGSEAIVPFGRIDFTFPPTLPTSNPPSTGTTIMSIRNTKDEMVLMGSANSIGGTFS